MRRVFLESWNAHEKFAEDDSEIDPRGFIQEILQNEL
jgi:hypothetical protein